MFFKARNETKTESKIILGMVLLRDSAPFDLKPFLKEIKSNNLFEIGKHYGDKDATTITLDGELVAIGSMPVPVPWGDIEGTAKYAYNWENAIIDLQDHKGHLIVSMMQGTDDQLKRYRIFTSVICALLRTNNAIGVYKGNQSLLIPKADYLGEAEGMNDDSFPLNLWIYFGLRKVKDKSAGYTYGLKAFNKRELEVLDSEKDLADIRKFLYNIAHYILDFDVEFEAGQTCGLSENERIKITLTPGQFVDTETFKLAY